MIRFKTACDNSFLLKYLISAPKRPLVKSYYQAIVEARDIVDNPLLSVEEKTSKINDIRQAFLQPDKGNDLTLFRGLGRLFVTECLDASLFLDLLLAFERNITKAPIRIWEELLDYCRYSAAPIGRFILAVYDETPSAYLPSENLCAVLQILNHLENIKYNLSLFNRCYFPLDMMQSYDVYREDLGLNYTTPAIKNMLNDTINKVEAMLADAEVLPRLIKNFRLRFNICVILSLTNSVIQRNKNIDVLQAMRRPNICDWGRAVITGLYRTCFGKSKQQGRVL